MREWALFVSLIAMLLISSSYFYKKKSLYLLFQALGMVFLVLSYLLTGEYFAMIGLGIGLARALTFFAYEKADKEAPLVWVFAFSALTVFAYVVVNLCILQTVKPLDIIYLLGLIGYIVVFRIRNLNLVRYLALIPTALSLLYNVLIVAVPFVIVSYAFELAAALAAIVKYRFFTKDKEESLYEEN